MKFLQENLVLNKIKTLCTENNYSLYKLSKESGVPLSTLTSMFSNNNFPTIPTLIKICSAFHITISDFFLIENTPEHIREEHKLLIKKYEELSVIQKHYLDAYLNGLSCH